MMRARVTNQKLRRRMWSVRGRGTISRPFYKERGVVPTGKLGVEKSRSREVKESRKLRGREVEKPESREVEESRS
jgi:hypothetical protein